MILNSSEKNPSSVRIKLDYHSFNCLHVCVSKQVPNTFGYIMHVHCLVLTEARLVIGSGAIVT